MAVELKKFQAEQKTIDTALSKAYGEWKVLGDSQGNTKKLLDGARLAIGDQIEKLKTNGAPGKEFKDFADDPVVKQAVATAKTALANFKKTEERKIATLNDFKKAHKSLTDLASRMDAEIADRKKKLFEPKSLPEMIKVAKAVRDSLTEEGGLKSESLSNIIQIKITAGSVEKKFWEDVDSEAKKSGAIRANAALTDLLEKFKPRLMKLRGDKVGSLAQECEKLCAAAKAAAKPDLAKKAVETAVAKVEELSDIVGGYNEAYTKNKSFLERNPDHAAIFAFVSKLTTTQNRILKLVQAAQAGK